MTGRVLTPGTVAAIEGRMVTGPNAWRVLRGAALAVTRPNPGRLIPYLGWALSIGDVLYSSYEAYNAQEIDWGKLEGEVYDGGDMAVFRVAYLEAQRRFLSLAALGLVEWNRGNYILICSEVMPMVANVDTRGIAEHGNRLRWDPANARMRRARATGGRGPVGYMTDLSGAWVRGSWEEYPFAATEGPTGEVLVDRVPLRENWIQGGFIRAASGLQQFQPGQTVEVFVV